MPIDFYYYPASAPCRSIQMTAKAVGVPMTLKTIDILNGEQMQPEYLALNPQHTVPLLVDNSLMLNESKAIIIYLVEKYGKPDDPLYPRDIEKRAIINQRLYFDMDTLYQRFAKYYYPVIFGGATDFVAEDYTKIEEVLEMLNTFLGETAYIAGDTFTIADISLVATFSTFVNVDGFTLGKGYPNVSRWFNKCKAVTPGYNLNIEGVREFRKFFVAAKK